MSVRLREYTRGALVAILVVAAVGDVSRGGSMLDATGRFAVRWWTVEDGLPQVPLTSLAIARDGAVWCSSRERLIRFDGQSFNALPTTVTDHLYGSIGTFIGLCFDGTGRLLVMGAKGFACCPPTVDPARASPGDWQVIPRPEARLGQVFLDGDGMASVVGRGAVFRHIGGDLVEVPGQTGLATFPFTGATIDHQTRDLWVWGRGEARRMVSGEARDDAESLHGRIISMSAGPSGVWAGLVNLDAGTVDGAAVFRDGAWEEHAMTTKPRTPTREGHVREGPDGTVWLATHASFHALRDGAWAPVVEGISDFSLATQNMETDRQGFLWAACKGGLLSLGPSRLRVAPGPPCSVIHRCHDGTLLAGLPGEIVELEFPKDGRPLAATRRASLPGNVVPTCIAETSDGTLFVGSRDSFIYRIRGDEVRLVTQPAGVAMEVRNVSAIVRDAADRVWVGTDNGLAAYDEKTGSFRFVSSFAQAAPTPVLGLLPDGDGTLLVALQGRGIDRLHADGRVIHEVPVDLMPGRRLIRFCRTPDGTLWIGGDGGLLRWDRAGTKTLIDHRHGLVERAVVQAMASRGGRLWLAMRDGHLQGIRTADLDNLATGRQSVVRGIVFGPLDGIGEREVLGGCGFVDDDTLLVSTAGGMATIDTRVLESAHIEPPGRAVSIDRVARDRGVCFRYSAVTTDAFEQPLYQTRLTGVDLDWSPPVSMTERVYASVPPGRHRFEVRYVRGDDASAFPRASQEIDIHPAPWQTGWFIGLVAATAAALAGGASALASRVLARRRIKALEWERERERERTRIARDIHDSLGAGISRLAILSEVIRRDGRHGGEVDERLDAIYTGARSLTRSVDEIVWAVNPRNDTLAQMLDYISHDVQDAARAAGLALRVSLPERIPGDVPVPTQVRHHVCLAVRELVANVLQHAAAGEVRLAVELDPTGGLVITLADDGRGFDPGRPAADGHDGLRNVAERLGELSGRFVIDSVIGRGTRARIDVPLGAHASSVPARSGTQGVHHAQT